MYLIAHKDSSKKDAMKECAKQTPPIGLEEEKNNTPLPTDMSYFWPLNKNEAKLQVLM